MKKLPKKRRLFLAAIIMVSIGVSTGILATHYMTRMQSVAVAEAEVKRLTKQVADEKAKKEELARQAAEVAKLLEEKLKRHSDPVLTTVLVNKKHPMQPMSYEPANLVVSHGATLNAKAVSDFNAMYAAAAAAGQPFSVTSSYRSYASQVVTYNHWVGQSGQAVADTYSARPGYSEHQTGFVIDVAAGGCVLNCFGSTSQYQWFKANAATYGFVQRYKAGSEAITGYMAEEWHYRYVGVEVAKDMQAKNSATLEEYWGFEGGDYAEL